MTVTTWLLFTSVTLAAIASPGPAILLSIRNSIAFGLRAACLSSLGNVTGILLLAGVAAAGLGALLQSSAELFTVVKVIGAAYLVWLGVRQWRRPVVLATDDGLPTARPTNGRLFLEGVLVALSNPKAILFFTALFPPFVDRSLPLAPQFVVLTGTFMSLSFLALFGYAAIAGRARRWLRSERGVRLFGRIGGTLFVGMGLGLLASGAQASTA